MSQSFYDFLSQAAKEYERLENAHEQAKQEIFQYRQEDEIASALQKADDIQRRALHVFSEAEYDAYRDFRREHFESCKNSGRYVIELCGTGIGEAISVKCPVCGVEKDITDIGSW